MKKQKQKRKGGWSAVFYLTFWLMLAAMFTGLVISQASQYNHFKTELDGVLEELEREREIYRELLNDKLYYDSDAYIEQLAREQLGYVKPDEIVFKNLPD